MGAGGKVTQNPDSDGDVKLRWLDGDRQSDYIKADKLNPVVASRTDLVEDYSHIEQLGKAVTRLTTLDLSKCAFNSSSVASFTRSVSWAEASLTKVVITGAVIGADDVAALRSAAPAGCEVVW